MASMTYSTEFEARPETVFNVMDDIEQAKNWLGSLIEIEALTDGGNRVGAKTRHVYEENGRHIEMIEETLIYDPNRRMKIEGKNDQMYITAEYTLTPIGDKTRIDYSVTMKLKGWMRILTPIMMRISCKKVEEDFSRLKALVESA